MTNQARVAFNTLAALALVRRNDMSKIYELFKETPYMQTNREVFQPMLDYLRGNGLEYLGTAEEEKVFAL